MAEPKLTIIGVYRPQISVETWQEQWNITGEDFATYEHFDKLVLIEAIAEGLETSFDMAKFGQIHLTYRNFPSHMQVGYDEALLSSDGEAVIHRAMGCVSGTGPLRFAAYLHLYDPARPILWHGGEVTGPPVLDTPVRLQMLMPYNVI